MPHLDRQRPPLPTRLTAAGRAFHAELRRLVDAAGLSYRALEDATSSDRSESAASCFYSKSQWARWLNGDSPPPRKAVRRLVDKLAAEDLNASDLLPLWDTAFAARNDKQQGTCPAQLPIPVVPFVGRSAELARLRLYAEEAAAADCPVVVVIKGTAGVGKTALAVQLGHAIRDAFPDGQLFVNLRGFDGAGQVPAPGEILRRFLHAFDVPPRAVPTSPDDQAAFYRSTLTGRRVLIIIDNPADVSQVRPLLPASSGCLVLVTSRNQLAGLVVEGARLLHLDPLTSSEAHELLSCRLGQARVSGDPAADDIIRLCAHLPLALSIAAAHAAAHGNFPLAALAAEFRNRGLDALETGDPATSARAVFCSSYQYLSEPGARMFRLLGLHPGPDFSLNAAASLSGDSAAKTRKALDELVSAHLADENQPGRYALHDLLRVFAAEQAERHDSAAQRTDAARRLLDYYVHAGKAAALTLGPAVLPIELTEPEPGTITVGFTDRDEAATWFDMENAVLLTLTRSAASTGFDTHAWQLPWTLIQYLNRRGRWQDSVAAQRTALEAATRLGDTFALAQVHSELGMALGCLGEYRESEGHLRQAVDQFAAQGRAAEQAWALNGLAVTLEKQQRWAEALTVVKDALGVLAAIRYPRTQMIQGILENGAGWLHAMVGEYDEALAHCEQALRLLGEAERVGCVGDTLDSLGFIYRGLGDLDQSLCFYEQALGIYRETGDSYSEAMALDGMGDTLLAAGDEQAARESWLHAADLFGQVRHAHQDRVRAKAVAASTARHAEHTGDKACALRQLAEGA